MHENIIVEMIIDSSQTTESGVVDEKGVAGSEDDLDEQPLYHHGEPIITTGKDVSYLAVDLRDDKDQALTFRSIFLGTIFAGLGAALVQVTYLLVSLTHEFKST